MNWLSAGLMFVNAATVVAVLLGMAGRGLVESSATVALVIGAIVAAATWLMTRDDRRPEEPPPRYHNIILWLVGGVFVIFAVRSFCWLFYPLDGQLKIQNTNNLGDLSFHITLIKTFTNGVPLWPDTPVFVGSKLRYPAGIDLFNALLDLVHIDLFLALTWVGLLASLATFYAFYRWGGAFGVAGFLFNGGVAGFQVLRHLQFQEYQNSSRIAWKSVPLAMFVTQRGLLYSIPVGLLLLWHWREKFFRGGATSASPQDSAAPNGSESGHARSAGPLPFWVELALYATLPLFHVHTFLALSAVLFFFLIFSDAAMRAEVLRLILLALVPATFFVWLVSDNLRAGSMLRFHPGWVLLDPKFGEGGFFYFWFVNFGISLPLALLLVYVCSVRAAESGISLSRKLPEAAAFTLPAVALFVFGLFFATAPWEWDNLKLMVWGYFLILPYLWTELVSRWSVPVRSAICIAFFGSGFASLFGGLAANREGIDLIPRPVVDGVADGVRTIPVEARFASFPTYNHPLLLNGRRVVMGYPGHLWTQGYDYKQVEAALTQLMNGTQNWRNIARTLGVRYVFWGDEEKNNYPESTHPWESTAAAVVSGDWGRIYDLDSLEPNAPRSLAPKSSPSP